MSSSSKNCLWQGIAHANHVHAYHMAAMNTNTVDKILPVEIERDPLLVIGAIPFDNVSVDLERLTTPLPPLVRFNSVPL